MTDDITLLLTPMPQESSGVRKRLRMRPSEPNLWQTADNRVRLAHIGVGSKWATMRCNELLERHRPAQVYLLGVAAGARAGLRIGDLVLIKRAHVIGDNLEGDDALLEICREAVLQLELPEIIGAALQVDGIVRNAAEKARKGQNNDVDILDMETASVFREAQAAGIPCVSARVVFDLVTEDLLPLDSMTNEHGYPRWGSVFGYLAKHPWHLGQLMEYNGRMGRAAQTLGRLAKALVERTPART